MSLTELTARLKEPADLSPGQVELAAAALAAPEVPAGEKESFLSALADKGESAAEVAAFARAFRARAVDPGLQRWSAEAVDIVGTGGDHAGGFNISSLVVLTLASLGVKVIKHGNRGITSKCGSADLLAGLGVDLAAPPEKLRQAMAELGFVYLLAPNYHPAFKHIAPVRKALAAKGRRTVFNILGPLINPASPAHTVLGVFSPAWVPRLAGAMESLQTGAGLVVHGVIAPGQGIDELTTATANVVQGAGRLRTVTGEWRAEDFGLKSAPFAELQGGDVAANLAITRATIEGRGPPGLVDTIVLNTAVALWISGRVPEVTAGLPPAREHLLGGAVAAKIEAVREFYAP